MCTGRPFTVALYNIEMNLKQAEKLISKYHKGQYRANKVPVTHHLHRVSHWIRLAFGLSGEGTKAVVETVAISALGHDLLEDTKVTEKEVRKVFGETGYMYIKGMTNTWGDNKASKYAKRIAGSVEEVRLIKLADLQDNLANVTYNFSVLGKKWVKSYFLPTVTPTYNAVMKTKFYKYKKTADFLKTSVKCSYKMLQEELSRY